MVSTPGGDSAQPDPRRDAARYAVEHDPSAPREHSGHVQEEGEARRGDDAQSTPSARPRMSVQAIETWVDQTIRQAQREGAFDDLRGRGKPLDAVTSAERLRDPDWFVKGLVERERLDLSGAMPTGLALRRERAAFPESLLTFADEAAVRRRLEDFNARVLDDRRRPHVGPTSPPVVGRVDVEAMVAAWQAARVAAGAPQPEVDPPEDDDALSAPDGPAARRRRRRWWPRRRSR